MGKYYSAEKLKNRHTYVAKLLLFMPIAVVCLAAWLTADYFTIDCYNWWYIVLFPGLIALVCASVGNRDKKMENRAIQTIPADMKAVWDSKVWYGIRCMGIALFTLLAAVLCASMMLEQSRVVFHMELSAGEQVLAILVLFVTSLWQVPFCLFLLQLTGVFPMVLLHVGSYFVLAAELSLHPYFMLLPGGIAARMMCIILRILPNGLVAESGSLTFTPELLNQKGLPVGIAASLVWFLVFWGISRRWFERQVEQ